LIKLYVIIFVIFTACFLSSFFHYCNNNWNFNSQHLQMCLILNMQNYCWYFKKKKKVSTGRNFNISVIIFSSIEFHCLTGYRKTFKWIHNIFIREWYHEVFKYIKQYGTVSSQITNRFQFKIEWCWQNSWSAISIVIILSIGFIPNIVKSTSWSKFMRKTLFIFYIKCFSLWVLWTWNLCHSKVFQHFRLLFVLVFLYIYFCIYLFQQSLSSILGILIPVILEIDRCFSLT